MPIRFLEVECGPCKVNQFCPRVGSSPVKHGSASMKCRLVNGYGRTPVDSSILSEESLKIAQNQGPCLTIAEVPSFDEEGDFFYEITKIFSPPILHERETVNWPTNLIYPKSHS